MTTSTSTKLVPLVGDRQKMYAPIFSSSQSPMNVSLSIRATNEYIGNISITVVYWEDGQKHIIHDYLAGSATTPINFSIQTPTSLPPFMLYLDSDSATAVDIEVLYDLPLNVGPVTSNDEDIMSLEGTAKPLIVLSDFTMDNKLLIPDLKELYSTAETTRSPLIVDLDGDGVETTSVSGGVYFDHDSNGFAENSSWVGKDDGLLVRDLNNNGQIDDGTELFGNNSVLSSGEKATNGFEALKDLDSNNDGIFNSSDTAWNEVKVWKDSNQNGKVDDGELLILEQANISGINLNYQNSNTTDDNGNQHSQIGSYTKTDGTTSTITDVWFKSDLMNTSDKTKIDIPDDIATLPNIRGFGNVHDLHTAMALDTTGELKALVEQYITETDENNRDAILTNIIYYWAGVQNMDPNGRNPSRIYGNVLGDSRKLETIEEFMGEDFLGTWCWGERDPNPHGKAAPYILQMFDKIKDFCKIQILAQTEYKSLLEEIILKYDAETNQWTANVSAVVSNLENLYNTNISAAVNKSNQLAEIIKSYSSMSDIVIQAFRTAGTEYTTDFGALLSSFASLNTLGTTENDRIYGDESDNIIAGYIGNDSLYGNDGNDTLIGGTGNDYLSGGNGADTYIYNLGDGHDTIDNSDEDEQGTNADKILFGEDITVSMVTIQRDGYDLILKINENDDIRVLSYFDRLGTTGATIENIEFADGTVWNFNYVNTHWNNSPSNGLGFVVEGDNNDNNLSGTTADDFIIGNAGNDTLQGGDGNDVLYGGYGNDSLLGGKGNDTYIYNLGDGFDTISETANEDSIAFGPSISFDKLAFRSDGYHLIISLKGVSDIIKISDFFKGINYKVENLNFADGSSIKLSEIGLKLDQLDAGETIYGSDFDDTIYAAGGDDKVNAGSGNDTIYGGGGRDTINGGSGNDIIYGNNGDDTLSGGDGNDVLYGNEGFDYIYGEAGNDTLIGGTGNDYLSGGVDNDTYIYNKGDGFDRIYDSNGNSTIQFGEGISLDNLTFRRSDDNLIIIINWDENQGIQIDKFFYSSSCKNYILTFADGSSKNLLSTGLILQQTDENEKISATNYDDKIYGNGGNDTLSGGDGNDVLYGDAGDDTLNGEDGNDTLVGGKGDDRLNGGNGNNTFIYNLGDGFDKISSAPSTSDINTVQFGKGISFDDFIFRRSDDNLIMTINGDETQGIQFYNFFFNNSYKNYTLTFADGSSKNLANIGLILHQTDDDDNISATRWDDVIHGNGGNDTLSGRAGNDVIYGGAGDDTLNGNEGNDTLVGGKGDDNLNGGYGSDTYIYNLGDGFDSISDSGEGNTIQFGEGIRLDTLTFTRTDDNLIITINEDKTQGIQLYNFFFNSSYKNYTLTFADGSSKNLSNTGLTLQQTNGDESVSATSYDDIIYGNGGNDTLSGGSGDDILNGGAGNDTLTGGDGNDTLIGGKGDDSLNGNSGNDIYVYNLGDGFDTISDSSGSNIIQFGENIAYENLSFRKEGNDLYININNDNNQGICIYNFYYSSSYRRFTMQFADGSSHNLSAQSFTLNPSLNQTVTGDDDDNELVGGDGNDVINSGDGYDDIYGGKGNDTLNGGYDCDTYYYNIGDGRDTILDPKGQDKIVFGNGISATDVSYLQNGNDLQLIIQNNQEQTIVIKKFFENDTYKIEQLQFNDGTIINLTPENIILTQSDKDDIVSGTAYNDTIYGNAGNDVISAGDGNDTIIGGFGNDTLNGGTGNDTYVYNLGDGLDVITESGGNDKIVFGEGINPDDLKFYQENNALMIYINNNPKQGIVITNFFTTTGNMVETLEFSDGTTRSLNSLGFEFEALNHEMSISGTAFDDKIHGSDYDDVINGGAGDDELTGNQGNDTLNGGIGDDTYIYNLGDGFDTISDSQGSDKIVFGEGISAESLKYSRDGDSLVIIINNNIKQGIKISNFFTGSNKIEILQFADNSTLNIESCGFTFEQNNSYETITGTNYDDVIYAYGGNDVVNAGDGNDTIIGGLGNDRLNGGSGNDTYIYNLGDGKDIISDTSGMDNITFGEGIAYEDIRFSQEGNNLKLLIGNDASQSIIISNFFASDENKVETLKFANGDVYNIAQSGLVLHQNNRIETVTGTLYDDTIYGYGGADTINAGAGNDLIVGGDGNDILNGGSGDDTYIYNLGDGMDIITDTQGSDTILFGEGISAEDLRYVQEGGNLRIYVDGDNLNNSILINGQFSSQASQIEKLKFSDGSILNLTNMGIAFNQYDTSETINGTVFDDVIYAGSGHDIINAGDGDDILVGGKGNDTLKGGYGRDTYIYNLGDGCDTITETQGRDKIKFGTGIMLSNLTFTQNGNNLIITINEDKEQRIIINNFYAGNEYKVESLEFSNGSTFNLSTQGLTLLQTNANETINGTSYNDIIYGNGGHDTVNAGEGNDTIIGGIGNDTLNGGNGDDTYVWNLGDGFDTISESGGNDKIVFGEGINQNDLSFERIGNNLKISVNGNEIQGIQINNQFSSASYKVETIEFHDGSTLNISNADQLIQAMNSFGINNSSLMDTLSDPTQDVSDMYSLTANSDLTKKAI